MFRNEETLVLTASDVVNHLACQHLTTLELRNLERASARRGGGSAAPAVAEEGRCVASSELERDRAYVALVGGAVDDATDESGWAHLGAVGNNLTKTEPDFDSRNYGYSKLSDLLEASKLFEIKRKDQIVRVRRLR